MLEYKYSNIIKTKLNSFSGQRSFNLILLANVLVTSAYSKYKCCLFCLLSKDISCTDPYGKLY